MKITFKYHKYICNKCKHINDLPSAEARHSSDCAHCGKPLTHAKEATGEESALLGTIGGIAVGMVGGPWGVVIGGVLGYIFGKITKGVG